MEEVQIVLNYGCAFTCKPAEVCFIVSGNLLFFLLIVPTVVVVAVVVVVARWEDVQNA